MKPLSHRLKPEFKQMFELELVLFPTSMKFVMEELDSKHWVSELTLGCVSTIASITNLQSYMGTTYPIMFMVDTLSSMFEPVEIC